MQNPSKKLAPYGLPDEIGPFVLSDDNLYYTDGGYACLEPHELLELAAEIERNRETLEKHR